LFPPSLLKDPLWRSPFLCLEGDPLIPFISPLCKFPLFPHESNGGRFPPGAVQGEGPSFLGKGPPRPIEHLDLVRPFSVRPLFQQPCEIDAPFFPMAESPPCGTTPFPLWIPFPSSQPEAFFFPPGKLLIIKAFFSRRREKVSSSFLPNFWGPQTSPLEQALFPLGSGDPPNGGEGSPPSPGTRTFPFFFFLSPYDDPPPNGRRSSPREPRSFFLSPREQEGGPPFFPFFWLPRGVGKISLLFPFFCGQAGPSRPPSGKTLLKKA